MDTIFMDSENSRTPEYHVLVLLDYFEYILKKHSESIDNPSIRIYSIIHKIKNRVTFKIKNGYYLELLTPETMELLGSTVSKINKTRPMKTCVI